MSNRASSFENTKVGVTPEGWTATLTGSGDPKWTVESDETAPSKSKVLKQSGRATYPLLLKNDTSIKDGFHVILLCRECRGTMAPWAIEYSITFVSEQLLAADV